MISLHFPAPAIISTYAHQAQVLTDEVNDVY